mgnify:FL=1
MISCKRIASILGYVLFRIFVSTIFVDLFLAFIFTFITHSQNSFWTAFWYVISDIRNIIYGLLIVTVLWRADSMNYRKYYEIKRHKH